MRNRSDDTSHNFARPERSGVGQKIASVLLLLVVGGGAFVVWQKYGGFVASSGVSATQLPTNMPAVADASDDAAPSVKDLQASQQQIADKLEVIQRQLASEQGERRLLSEQVAALSGRVSGLSGSHAAVTTGTAPLAVKKKPNLLEAGALKPPPPAPSLR
jgi:uncharacterized protein HemX